jgi:LysR family hydrogen peroxide-inducible transcriptional activator
MTLTELRYIVAVARERHFSRAAESCHVSQPTLSVGVRKLEEALEVQRRPNASGRWPGIARTRSTAPSASD